MTAPAQAALRVAWGLALGALAGMFYDFLRPLRRRHNAPADCLFVLFAFVLWVYYSFGICLGDIRFGGTASMGIGAFIWISALGKPLRKVFFLFWAGVFHIFSWIFLPMKKFLRKIQVFLKKVFASGKKRGTIEWRNRRHRRGHSEEPT